MVVKFVVDSRERSLIESLQKTVSISSASTASIVVEVKQLDVGDVEIWVGEDGEGLGFSRPLLVIERKTVADFASSIMDGRYAEQRHRLVGVAGSDRVMYVIEKGAYILRGIYEEGPLDDPVLSRMRGALTSMLVNHRIPVAFTSSVDDTAAFLVRAGSALLKRVKETENANENANDDALGTGGYSGAACRASIAQAKKRDNVDPRQCFLQQLCQIPGVSHRIASHILDKVVASSSPHATEPSSIATLVRLLDALPGRSERLAMLREIPLVGKKVSERILEFIG